MPFKQINHHTPLAPRVLVTGGSGFIGTHLIRRLVKEGSLVTSVDKLPPREILDGVLYIQGDVRDLTSLPLGAVDHIVNLAAIHTTPGHPDHEYYDTNVLGALEVVRFAERERVQNITFTSSISVYGPSEERKVETSTPAPVSAYGKSKLMAEKIQINWVNGTDLRHLTILRPAVVFGQGEGGNFTRMARILRSGFFIFPGRRDTIKSCIYVDDLITLMYAGSQTKERLEIINGAYPETPTLLKIVSTLRSMYFPKAIFLDIPSGLVKTLAKALKITNGLGLGLGIHPDRVDKLIKSTNVYPEWAVKNNALSDVSLTSALKRWADTTNHKFI